MNDVLNPSSFELLFYEIDLKARLALLEMKGNQVEMKWSDALHALQQSEHHVRIFAPRHRHHDAVTVGDHISFDDRSRHLASQFLF